MTNVGQAATAELVTRRRRAGVGMGRAGAGPRRGRARASVGARDLRGARRPHADRADPRGRGLASRRQRDHGFSSRPGHRREVWGVVQARRRGRAAARLHVRIVALFSIIAAVPAVLVAVVASVTLDRGLDRLFSQQMQSMIENSLIVADAYVREQRQFVRADSIAIAIELARAKPMFDQSREQFHQFLAVQASIRGLPAVMLLDKDLNVIDQVDAEGQPGVRQADARGARRPSTTASRRWGCSSTPTTSPPSSSCAATTTSISTSRACSTRACWRNCGRRRPGVAPICRPLGSAASASRSRSD